MFTVNKIVPRLFFSMELLSLLWLLNVILMSLVATVPADEMEVLVAEMPRKFQVAGSFREVNAKDSGEITRTTFGGAKYENPGYSQWKLVGTALQYNGTLRLNAGGLISFEQRQQKGKVTLDLFSGQISYVEQVVNLHLAFKYLLTQFEYFSLSGLNQNDIIWSIETVLGRTRESWRRCQGDLEGDLLIQAEQVKANFYAMQEDAIAGEIMKTIHTFVHNNESR